MSSAAGAWECWGKGLGAQGFVVRCSLPLSPAVLAPTGRPLQVARRLQLITVDQVVNPLPCAFLKIIIVPTSLLPMAQVLSGLHENLHNVHYLDVHMRKTCELLDAMAQADAFVRCACIGEQGGRERERERGKEREGRKREKERGGRREGERGDFTLKCIMEPLNVMAQADVCAVFAGRWVKFDAVPGAPEQWGRGDEGGGAR